MESNENAILIPINLTGASSSNSNSYWIDSGKEVKIKTDEAAEILIGGVKSIINVTSTGKLKIDVFLNDINNKLSIKAKKGEYIEFDHTIVEGKISIETKVSGIYSKKIVSKNEDGKISFSGMKSIDVEVVISTDLYRENDVKYIKSFDNLKSWKSYTIILQEIYNEIFINLI